MDSIIRNIHKGVGNMVKVNKVQEFFKGKKTYIVAVLIGAVVIANQLGYLDANATGVLLGLLGASGLAAVRLGIAGK